MFGCCCAPDSDGGGVALVPVSTVGQEAEENAAAQQKWGSSLSCVRWAPTLSRALSPGGGHSSIAPLVVMMRKDQDSTPLGMEVDCTDQTKLQVMELHDGVVQDYNRYAPEAGRIEIGGFIMEVNGVRGDSQAMVRALRQDQDLVVEVSGLEEFEITLPRSEGEPLGLDLHFMESSNCLLVRKVLDGPAKAHNTLAAASAGRLPMLLAMDRIVEANGCSGAAPELLATLRSGGGPARLRVQRPAGRGRRSAPPA